MDYNYTYTSTSGNSREESREDDIDPIQQLNLIKATKNKLTAQEGELLEKALQSKDPDVLMRANKHWHDVQAREASGVKSELMDPNEWSEAVGYRNKRLSLSYGMLRRMAQTPVIKAIISTRQTQVSAFSSPQSNKYETGFIVRKKRDFYTKDEPEITKADKKIVKDITTFLINGGERQNAWHGDSFDAFLKKITADTLMLDQGCFEVVRSRGGIPIEFLAVDAATIRIADSYDDDKYDGENQIVVTSKRELVNGYYPSYVQVLDSTIRAEYYPWELCFGIRNSSTDITNNGYGRSEVEELMSVITWMLYADAYNGKFFSQGSSPKGMLKVSSGVNRNRLAEFRQQWQSMVAGVENAWKIPMIESDKMEWIDLQKNNTDMQFGQWQEYLIKISCAIFKIAPEEVGFNLGNASGGGAMFESGNEAKLKYSKDKGLLPLLKNIEFWINKWIINAINEDYEFKFVGMDVDSEEKELDMDVKRVGNFMGFKEVRKKHNLPQELEEGDFILNPQYTQMIQGQQYAEDQQVGGEMVEEDEGDMWASLGLDDEEAVKAIMSTSAMSEHRNNPMMIQAVDMLMKGGE
jgi:hypothetical protein